MEGLKMKRIEKAIIPVAGFGTRFLPVTKSQPKEMLPIIDRPAVQYIVEEAVNAGIKKIIFVTARGKHSIENYFDQAPELENLLKKQKKNKYLRTIKELSSLADFCYLRQNEPRGDGDAIYQAASSFLAKDEPAIVLFGDDIIKGPTPVKDLIKNYNKVKAPIVALYEVPKEEIHRYGIAEGKFKEKRLLKIDKFIEKPKEKQTKSRLAAIGKYVITPDVIKELKNNIEKSTNKDEIRLSDAFVSLLKKKKSLYGLVVKGERFDCGNKFGLLKASIEYGLEHPEIKDELKKYLLDKSNNFKSD